ncbi:class I SAM-dependent methyltransferase [Streptomyces sp. CC228A]|uniref:class I SAM-dependent methyltransferase n=1 Tax=Streptomyces sp. CC228A TaxID=2898186 RepID=UPI001F361F0E|nr:methyltransferase domain-containing protein [Streptomyces sp. CC228A]
MAAVSAARLRPGARVLNAWCGTGAFAIPAAEQVGPLGVIDAVDMAEPLLERGRAKAALLGLANVRFLRGDVLDWPAPRGGYDTVVCALDGPLVSDAAAATERLLRLIRPGGRMTVTAWARDAFVPLTEVAQAALAPERPGAVDAPPPGDPLRPLGTPQALRHWLAARSLSFIDVQYVPLVVPCDPELLRPLADVVFGGLLDGLPTAAATRVRRRFSDRLLAEGRDVIDASVLVGTGTVPRVTLPRRPRGARPLTTAGRPAGPVPQFG